MNSSLNTPASPRVHLSNEPDPGRVAFLIRSSCFLIERLYRFRSLQAFGLPSGRGEPHIMEHVWPFALGSGGSPLRSIEPISPDISRSTRGDMLCQLHQETHHGEGFDLSLEETVMRSCFPARGNEIRDRFVKTLLPTDRSEPFQFLCLTSPSCCRIVNLVDVQ